LQIGERGNEGGCLKPIYRSDTKNPLPWMDQMRSAIEHTNLSEGRAIVYSKASTRGIWEEAFSQATNSGRRS
jgi:ribonucleoside-diphosphate reductase beta chain